jgi:hypothetical protein
MSNSPQEKGIMFPQGASSQMTIRRNYLIFSKKFKTHGYISQLNMDISITTITSPSNCFNTCLGFGTISNIVVEDQVPH